MNNNKAFEKWYNNHIDNTSVLNYEKDLKKAWNAACEIKDKIIKRLAKRASKYDPDCPKGCKCLKEGDCDDSLIQWTEKEVAKDEEKKLDKK